MTKIIDLNITHNLEGIANPYLDGVKMALSLMKEVLESQEFKNCLFEEIFSAQKDGVLPGERSEWRSKAPLDIYRQFLALNMTDKIGSMDLVLKGYYNKWTSAIGYGLAGKKEIYLNIAFLDKLDFYAERKLAILSSLIAHEHSHKTGFVHDFRNTAVRNTSISYIINIAFSKAYDQLRGNAPSIALYRKPWYKRIFSWIKSKF